MIERPSEATRPSRLLVARPFLFPAQAFKDARERSSRKVLTRGPHGAGIMLRVNTPTKSAAVKSLPSPTDDKTRQGVPRGATPLRSSPPYVEVLTWD